MWITRVLYGFSAPLLPEENFEDKMAWVFTELGTVLVITPMVPLSKH